MINKRYLIILGDISIVLLVIALILVWAKKAQASLVRVDEPFKTALAANAVFQLASSDKVIQPSALRAQNTWEIECADCRPFIWEMTDRSLHLDNAGLPHIVYGQDQIYYSWYGVDGWHSETVDNSLNNASSSALDLDTQGYAYISYVDATHNLLKVASQNASGWQIDIVDSNLGQYSGGTSIILAGDGYARISYFDGADDTLKYAQQDATGWHIQVVDTGLGEYGGHTSLAFDANGYAHISYYNYANGDLNHAFQSITGWNIEQVDTPGDVGLEDSLALDVNGYAHIGYYDASNGYLKYAYQDNSGWHIEVVDTDGLNVGRFPSIALDNSGYPHISYGVDFCPGPCSNLRFAYKDGSGWHTVTVDNKGDAGWRTSLALDQMGIAHISYYGGTGQTGNFDGDLKYARQDQTIWELETVRRSGSAGQYVSLRMKADDMPCMSYYDDANQDLYYTCKGVSGWQTQIIDSQGDVGRFTSLILDQDGYAHISYIEYEGGYLKYAYQDASGWYSQTIDHGIGQTSIALDQSGHPHIGYVDWNSSTLKYAYQDASAWYTQTIPGAETVCRQISLALDAYGYAHISAGCQDGLKYIYQNAADWHIESIPLGTQWGNHSLVLDPSGYPHISYNYGYGSTSSLKYTYYDPTGWHTVDVDTSNYVAEDNSLALDDLGYPHISYTGSNSGGLKYAYQDRRGWHLQIVDENGNPGQYNSLVLDHYGYPHIAYNTQSYLDLRYAKVLVNPPESVDLRGLTHGCDSITYVFNATVEPFSTTEPVQYRWQATNQIPITHSSGLSDTATFFWNSLGNQMISVTVSNPAGTISNTHSIFIGKLNEFYLPLVTRHSNNNR